MSFSTTFKPFDPLAPLPFKSLKSLETALNLEDVPIEQTSEKSEEIVSFTLDEDMEELDRASFLLTKGHVRQKLSVCLSFASLVREFGEDATSGLTDALLEFSQSRDAGQDHLLAFADSLEDLCSMSSVSFFRGVLPTVLALAEAEDSQVATKFRSLAVRMVEGVLNEEALREHVVPFATARVGLGKKPVSRILAASLFGALAKRFPSPVVQRDFLKQALSLCQDMDSEVRAVMTRQLRAFAACLGASKCAETVLPELLELLKDNDNVVKGEAVKEAVELMDFLDRDTCKSSLVPILLALGVGIPRQLKLTLATVIGPLLVKCRGFLREDNINVFLDAYRELARRGDPDIRYQCAFNFPAVISVAGESRYSSHLHALHEFFAADEEESIRMTIAASLHEVAGLITAPKVDEFIKPLFVRLLMDDKATVTDSLLNNIGDLLRIVTRKSGEGSSSCLLGVGSGSNVGVGASPRSVSPRGRSNSFSSGDRVVNSLLDYESRIRSNWRLLSRFLLAYEHFSKFMSSDALCDKFLPVALRHLSTLSNPLPVHEAAARATLFLVRSEKLGLRRYEVCERLAEDFAEGKTHKLREIFLLLCRFAMELFSRQFVQQHFLSAALNLWRDSVANVRLKFCRLLPSFKLVLKPPTDLSLAARLNEALSHLLLDRDTDVVQAATKAQAEMKDLEEEFARESRYGMKSEEDEQNRQKEEEEKRLFQGEDERLRKIRRESDRLTGGGGSGSRRARPGLPASRGSAGSLTNVRKGGVGNLVDRGARPPAGSGSVGGGGRSGLAPMTNSGSSGSTGSGGAAPPGASLLSVDTLSGSSHDRRSPGTRLSSVSEGSRPSNGQISRSPGRRSSNSPTKRRSGGGSSSSSSVSSNVSALTLHSSSSTGKTRTRPSGASRPKVVSPVPSTAASGVSSSSTASAARPTGSSSGASRFVTPVGTTASSNPPLLGASGGKRSVGNGVSSLGSAGRGRGRLK